MRLKKGKDVIVRSNACLKCGMIGHFVRDCTVGAVEPVDDNASPVVEKIQTTVKANFPVTDEFPKITI